MTEHPTETEGLERAKVENRENLDDHDDTPSFIKKLFDNPSLLPPEYRKDFEATFCEFEFMNAGRAKTALDYILVNEATKLTLNIERYDRMRASIFTNQKRHALVMLLRNTHEAAAMEGAEAALRVSAHLDANKYFSDSAFRARADRAFEAAGYAPDALEGEAFVLALRDLAVVDKLIASAQKRLIAILKELEARYASRNSKK